MDFVHLICVILGFGLPSCFHAFALREYHYINLKMNWTDAQHYCRVKHDDLATIESMDDISRLNRPNDYTSEAWIGLYDDPKSWKGIMGNDVNSWRWSATGETSTTEYQNWDTGQPDFYLADESCVRIEADGSWHDAGCHSGHHFVCYQDTSTPGQKTYTLIENLWTWKDAQAYCRASYKDLATIENDQENSEVLSMNSGQLWIGLYRVPWRWSDKSSRSFENWGSGQPNNGGGQYCVAEDSDHFWLDGKCGNKYPFWCQGALKVKQTIIRMKMQTAADLSDPAVNAQILQQIGAMLKDKALLTDFQLKWTTQPKKEEETQEMENV